MWRSWTACCGLLAVTGRGETGAEVFDARNVKG